MVPPKYLSVIGTHVSPPSTDLKTPPPTVPIQYSWGRATLPAAAAERPPRNGPISRHFMADRAPVSNGAASGAIDAGRAATRAAGRAGCALADT